MNKRELIHKEIDCIFNEIKDYINILYVVPDIYSKNLLLNQMWSKVASLQIVANLLLDEYKAFPPPTPIQMPQIPMEEPKVPVELPVFALDQLARFNGKNGNPAYIAVNGLIYDVTNNAAWAAASHFGLIAGKDLTKEFASCHTGQSQILKKLKVVGRLTT